MADFTFWRSDTCFSSVSARRRSTWSSTPPDSPARTIDTYSAEKTLGCLPMAADSAVPVSMSLRTSPITLARALFSVCSARMFSDRSRDRPELIIVANWRLKTARSFSFTRSESPGIFRSAPKLTFGLRSIVMGRKPWERSRAATAVTLSASTSPSRRVPLLSRTL